MNCNISENINNETESINQNNYKRLTDFVVINPKEKLKKNTVAKKVGMDKLHPYTKQLQGYSFEKYKGGSKFRNGDTLFARITPCLENGKTAQVTILDENEIGFGSTEFIVLRAMETLSDSDYIYYLCLSKDFRNIAIKSMVGTSGRQRVQQSVIEQTKFFAPNLPTQKKIASILSALDDKIELNKKINKNLEEMAQAIFKSWFVDFEPWGGEMPDDWEYGTLGEICEISSGKRPKVKSKNKTQDNTIPIIGASSIMGYTNKSLYNESLLITGRVGTHGIIQKLQKECWPSDNTLVIKSIFYNYTYQLLSKINYKNLNRGSTQPLITQTDLKKIPIVRPTDKILFAFEKLTKTLMNKNILNNKQNQNLKLLRDTLLPKLMSGELDISNLEI